MEIKLPFGLKEGELVDITMVDKGLACGCICPSCEGKLIAKKGTIKQEHFAHANGLECRNALETSLHIYVKNLLSKNNSIVVPRVCVAGELLFDYREIFYDKVELEHRTADIIPDVVVYVNDKPLIIEVVVTNPPSWQKKQKVKNIDYGAIVINARNLFRSTFYKTFSFTEFDEIILKEPDFKSWLNNSKQNIVRSLIHSFGITKPVKEIGLSDSYLYIVDNCPLNKRIWKSGFKEGRSYAAAYKDCQYCQFGNIINDDELYPTKIIEVNCIGHSQNKIAEVIDSFKAKMP